MPVSIAGTLALDLGGAFVRRKKNAHIIQSLAGDSLRELST